MLTGTPLKGMERSRSFDEVSVKFTGSEGDEDQEVDKGKASGRHQLVLGHDAATENSVRLQRKISKRNSVKGMMKNIFSGKKDDQENNEKILKKSSSKEDTNVPIRERSITQNSQLSFEGTSRPVSFIDDAFAYRNKTRTGIPRSSTVTNVQSLEHRRSSEISSDASSTISSTSTSSSTSTTSSMKRVNSFGSRVESRPLSSHLSIVFHDEESEYIANVFGPNSDFEVSTDNGKVSILSGSVDCLIDFLAPQTNTFDNGFVTKILYTYRYFTTADYIVEKLCEKFTKFSKLHQDATDPDEKMLNMYVCMRVLNVFRKWASSFYSDLVSKPEIEKKIASFARDIISQDENFGRYALPILQTLEDQFKSSHAPKVKSTSLEDLKQSTRRRIQSTPVTQLDPQSFARQLTIKEMELYKSIPIEELYFQAWVDTKKNEKTAPHVLEYIKWFNHVTTWVATEVNMAGNAKDRGEMIKYFVNLAKICISFGNFNTAFEIVSGLNLPSVSRLKKSWSNVPSKYMKIWEEISALLSPSENYKNYRMKIREAILPALPYIGVFLTDLVYAETGSSTTLITGKVNFFKMETIAQALNSIMRFQEKSFPFQSDKKTQQWLTFSMVVMDEDLLLKASYRSEPPPEEF